MLQTTLRGLWSHKRRLISTCLAVVLGVAFMTGTLVLSSTINKVFDDLFGDLGQGVDAVVRGPELFDSQVSGQTRDLLDESVVQATMDVDGVAAAEGSIGTFTLTLLDDKGDPMGGFGPPTIVGSWGYDDAMSSYQVDEGREPEADDEVIIDRAAVDKGGFDVGETVTLISGQGRDDYTLVGVSMFGTADSAGGSTFVGTTLAEGQRLAGEEGRVDTVNVRAEDGVSPDELVANLEAANLAPKVDIVTGEQAAKEQASDVKSGFAFFTIMLTVFALISLFVGWFIISNTFGILVAQRTRELALLRAIGATRRQVLGSVFLEAGVIGIVSSVVGFASGVVLAIVAFAGLAAAGIDLPTTSLVVEPYVAGLAVAIGLFITAVAAIGPAIKATRVPPIAALRSTAIDESGSSKIRLGIGLLAIVVGILLVLPAFDDLPTSDQLPSIGFGLFLLLASVLILGPVIARPLAAGIGSWIPLVKGVTGKLARQNAMRSPRRTASTAAALIIGVTLVSFITIFASSAQQSVSTAIGSGFDGDYIVQPVNQFTLSGVTPDLATEIDGIDGVQTVTSLAFIDGQIGLPDGSKTGGFLGGIDPASFGEIFNIRMATGSLTDLVDGTMVVDETVAKEKDIAIGDEVSVLTKGGRTETFTVSAISNEPALLGQWTLTKADANALSADPSDFLIGIKLEPGVDSESIRPDLRAALEPYPTMKLQDREQYTSSIVNQISALLNVIYALLAVSIFIAVIGIANTLRLSIHERTRELGLLRAMGMTRSQLRSSVRWEAVIVALMGTSIGIILGIGLSWIMVKALVGQGITEFTVEPVAMVLVVVFGAVLGVVASLMPAYRASKLNVLEAIATE